MAPVICLVELTDRMRDFSWATLAIARLLFDMNFPAVIASIAKQSSVTKLAYQPHWIASAKASQ
jgi:hypothetical protein